MNPFFSIIIPTYNRASMIPKAIESVLQQTFVEWELIIIDDGSIDNTAEIVKTYTDSRIKYIWQENQERSVARNKGISIAKGRYICFLDSDNKYYEKDGRPNIIFVDENNIITHHICPKDFDEISKIILFQNDINYDDRYISPDMRKEIEQYYKLKYKDSTPPTIEKKKAFVISKTGISLNEINNMVFRMFDQVYQASIDSEIYIGNKIIQASQKYDVKGNIEHPMFEVKKDPILSAMGGDAEVFENKIQQINNN